MKADLANNWIMMCLLPYGVAEEHRNKFVACMLGDEIASDEEFWKMADDGCEFNVGAVGCRFSYDGACFHPFRPGSLCDAIFSSAMRGCGNAEPLVNEEACKALDHRHCNHCRLSLSKEWDDTEFERIERFYSDLIEDASKHRTLYGRTYDELISRGLKSSEGKCFFPGRPKMKQYEDNVRRHFDKMTREHYKLIVDAIDEDSKSIGDVDEQNGKSALAKALMKVRLDLVTHWMNYWAAGKYKEEEA